jgi:hypothetical protein
LSSNDTQQKPQALLVLGCPEVALQTSLAIYTLNLLTKNGANVLIAGNNAALELVRTADPEGYYIKKTIDLDAAIASLAQKRINTDICYVFIHNDAGISYLATVNALIDTEAVGIIYGRESQALAMECDDLNLKYIWAKTVHNPRPLRLKIEKQVEHWAASNK